LNDKKRKNKPNHNPEEGTEKRERVLHHPFLNERKVGKLGGVEPREKSLNRARKIASQTAGPVGQRSPQVKDLDTREKEMAWRGYPG